MGNHATATRIQTTRLIPSLLLLLALPAAQATAGLDDWLDEVGFTKLEETLGPATPRGAGVTVSQVEAGSSGNFFPDENYTVPGQTVPEFTPDNDPLGEAVNFVNGSSAQFPNPVVSNHATETVGRWYYGNSLGIASATNTVVLYEANNYLSSILNANNSRDPEKPEYLDLSDGMNKSFVVQNHSWVGSLGSNSNDRRGLQKLDFVIDTYDMTAVVGVSANGDDDPNTPVPPHPAIGRLLAQSYNAISVGSPSGLHSTGKTESFYGGGRTKPEIVAAGANTSSNSAMVSSAAAMLHGVVQGTDAAKSETMKALLLAGATKDEFDSYIDPATGQPNPWAKQSDTSPLDDIFGAGQLNVYNSWLMTHGGQYTGSIGQAAGEIGQYGWDYQDQITPADDLLYEFTILDGYVGAEVSFILTWNMEIIDSNNSANVFVPTESFANLDLELTHESGQVLDRSVSVDNNVEHIYLQDLESGTYTVRVSSDSPRDYGLAWRIETLYETPSADFDNDGDVDTKDLLIWQSGYGRFVGANRFDGDADGDGDVDDDDKLILEDQFGTFALPVISVIPEPTSALLAALTSVLLCGTRRRR